MDTFNGQLAALQEAVEGVYGGTAAYRGSEHVQEAFEGKTVWEGDVYMFALSGHPTASTCSSSSTTAASAAWRST